MIIGEPIKKTFVRFFTKPRLFNDGYPEMEGNQTPINSKLPVLEVKSREISDLDFFIPESAVGFIFFDVITAQVEDNDQLVELTSGEINKSGRYFFQTGQHLGRIATKNEAPQEWDKHTYMRRYCSQPTPEKIILFPGPRDDRFRENRYHVCTFDFLATDVAVPIWFFFPHAHMIKAAAEKKGWVKNR